jgi:hypothetical protein
MTDVEKMRLDATLLIVYFDPENNESQLIQIDDSELQERSNFAAIGSGMPIAEAVFFQRKHSRISKLANSLYRVYEAMRLGGAASPGVGERFTMAIVHFRDNDAHWEYVEPGYHKLLENEFVKFGPKKLRGQTVHRDLLSQYYE